MIEAFVVGFVTSLAAGIVGGWFLRGRKYRQRYEAAVQSFSRKLGWQIDNADIAPEDMREVHARAIVKLRNDFRSTLSGVSQHLNSEIDKLDHLLNNLSNSTQDSKEILEDIKKTISVLKQTWSAKEGILENAIKKLLVDLGIEPF